MLGGVVFVNAEWLSAVYVYTNWMSGIVLVEIWTVHLMTQ
jgi:hypothetical protein